MATTKTARKRTKKKRASAPAASRGLDARRLASAAPPTAVATLARTVEDDGGIVLATYRDPHLKAFVVARINPLRFQRKPTADFDETIDKMLGSARRFDPARIKADQVARTGGAPSSGEE